MKLAPPGIMKVLKEHNIKILLSFYQVHRQVEDLCNLMYTMPLHSEKILAITAHSVNEFVDGSKFTFHKITAYLPGKEVPENIRWTEDEQFCLFYRALPGWFYRKTTENSIVQSTTTELETLLKMYDGSVAEIMNDTKVMRMVALIMENCEWLSHVLDYTLKSLPVTDLSNTALAKLSRPLNLIGTTNVLYPIPTVFLDPLRKASISLMDFAEKCFLAIHWEIRIRLLYYLHKTFLAPRADLTSQDVCEDAEKRVGLLVNDLWSISRTISHLVQENKFRFYYRNLGGLVRDIFIRSAEQMARINARAVKSIKRCLFHLEEALLQITGQKEPAFEEIRQYFDIFLVAAKPGVSVHTAKNTSIFSKFHFLIF